VVKNSYFVNFFGLIVLSLYLLLIVRFCTPLCFWAILHPSFANCVLFKIIIKRGEMRQKMGCKIARKKMRGCKIAQLTKR